MVCLNLISGCYNLEQRLTTNITLNKARRIILTMPPSFNQPFTLFAFKLGNLDPQCAHLAQKTSKALAV